jgi:alkyl sulfatase BDS1-like metallo-beta-lactamase superfamily hydrolase
MASPAEDPKDATPTTQAQNRAVLDALPFADTQDFEDARRGFLGTLPEVEIKNDRGRVVWSLKEYGFLGEEQAPPTVNPSLWRQARLNMSHGLFQVTDRIYQIRGFDISNMTIIEGDRGLIVIDPLISTEVARVGLDLYLGVRLNGDRAEGRRIVINWVFADLARPYVLNLENCALTYLADRRSERADATVTLDRATLDRLILRETTPVDAAQGGLARIEGDAAKVAELFSLLDDFALMFEVVEPKRPA